MCFKITFRFMGNMQDMIDIIKAYVVANIADLH
jgi:hypothetical protein